MRILDVTPRDTFPPRRGSDARIHNLLLRLSRRHEIRQFSLRSSEKREVHAAPSWREHRCSSVAAKLVSMAAERSWPRAALLAGAALRLSRPALLREWIEWADVIVVEFPWQFDYCRRLRPQGPLVLATHNIETVKFASWAHAQGLHKNDGRGWLRYIRRAEAAAVAHADLILTVSSEDRLGFIRLFGADPDRVVEVPNGADTTTYSPVDHETRASMKRTLGLPAGPVVSFVGCSSPPNVTGFEWIRRVAAIAERFTFVVTGSLFPRAERLGNTIITGPVEEISPWLQAADFSLCPIEHGGGTKIKLMEALAAGLPVIAFEESLHGTSLVPGRHVLLTPKNEDEIAFALHQLADSPALAERLGSNGRDYILQHHDWDRIAEKLEAALVQLVESANPSSAAQSSVHSSRSRG